MTLTPTDLAPTEDGYGTPAFQKAVYRALGIYMPQMILDAVAGLVEAYPEIDQRQAFRVAAVATAGGTSVSRLLEEVNVSLEAQGDAPVFPPEEIESALAQEVANLTVKLAQEGLAISEIQARLATRWPKATKEQLGAGILRAAQQMRDEAAGHFALADTMGDLFHAAKAQQDADALAGKTI